MDSQTTNFNRGLFSLKQMLFYQNNTTSQTSAVVITKSTFRLYFCFLRKWKFSKVAGLDTLACGILTH